MPTLPYDDVQYVTVSVGARYDTDATPLAFVVTAQAAWAAPAVHVASGDEIHGRPISKQVKAGNSVELVLLASDTTGLSRTDFDWTITVATLNPNGTVLDTVQKLVYLPKGTPENDFDLMAEVDTPTSGTVTLPVVVSVAGLSGEVTVEELNAAGVGSPDLSGYATTSSVTTALAGKVDAGDSRLTDARPATDASVAGWVGNEGSATDTALKAAFASAGGSPTASLALAPPRPRRQLIQTFQSGHGWSGIGAGTFDVNDTSAFTIGSQSVRVQTTGTGAGSNVYKWGGSAVDLTGKNLALLMKIENSTHLKAVAVQFGTSSMSVNTSQNFLTFAGTDQSLGPDGEWNWVVMPWTPAGGSPTRSAITDFTISFADDGAGTPVVIHLQALAAVPIPTAWTTGALTFSLDDGFLSHYTIARPTLARYDFPADAYPVCEAIDTTGAHMTTAQLQELQDTHGWLIGAHADTWSHHNVQPATEAEVDAFYRANRQWLVNRSLRGIDFFAYPRGESADPNLTLARRYFVAARTINQRSRETLPASDPHLVRVLLWEAATSAATITAEIDAAYANNYHLVLVAHDIAASGATGGSINAATFTTVVDYAATKGIPVKTTAEVFATR